MSARIDSLNAGSHHHFQFPGVFLRRLDFTGINLSDANLRNADAKNAIFARVNFSNADLTGTDLRGADLTGAKNLTIEQLQVAIVDENTRLPDYIDRSRLTLAPVE
ncbi:pentapeptide repeat-containing protein [Jiella marina]|uniref:pentapeptide repeat-containing protein n=1 Tax=Jiella sp. LLJ827 TaxID=2917712 RepID=UPI002100EBB2|nr:pentapeptide repeat-containing protein [Jiella sp. LLJ827]MCQ0986834.1 pentapeptide repeat-containing protein [Jiella sp. LLJ827]